MRISEADWQAFLGHPNTTHPTLEVSAAERAEVLGFVDNTKADIVET
jgi:hypothetical protein